MTTLMGRIVKLEVGENSGEDYHTDILTCKSIKWRKVHTITPRLLPSAKIPAGWLQSHSWIEGEFGLQTMDSSLDEYAPKDADAVIIPYFVVTAETTAKATKTFTFEGLIISSPEQGLGTDGEPIFTYKFLAYYVTEA